jgi:hypothetical protein
MSVRDARVSSTSCHIIEKRNVFIFDASTPELLSYRMAQRRMSSQLSRRLILEARAQTHVCSQTQVDGKTLWFALPCVVRAIASATRAILPFASVVVSIIAIAAVVTVASLCLLLITAPTTTIQTSVDETARQTQQRQHHAASCHTIKRFHNGVPWTSRAA